MNKNIGCSSIYLSLKIHRSGLGISRRNIYTKRKENSKHLEQIRSISLLNVEGKIFFGVIAKRMLRFVLNNKFINISIQKAGIPGFPGCIEHASILWDRIKAVRDYKSAELHVIWLDLENAYGSQ